MSAAVDEDAPAFAPALLAARGLADATDDPCPRVLVNSSRTAWLHVLRGLSLLRQRRKPDLFTLLRRLCRDLGIAPAAAAPGAFLGAGAAGRVFRVRRLGAVADASVLALKVACGRPKCSRPSLRACVLPLRAARLS